MKLSLIAPLFIGASVLATGAASAHFILVAPTSWMVPSNQLGDPQKAGPCGAGPATEVKPSNVITPMQGGSMLKVAVKETIYHPGFYRVALAVKDRSELPADPVATTRDTPRGPYSVSGKIESNPQAPVLADGLFLHHDKPEQGKQLEWSAEIKLPNINCDKCTIQVIQFMEAHGLNKEGDFTYHHCADIKITANPALPIDKAWPGQ